MDIGTGSGHTFVCCLGATLVILLFTTVSFLRENKPVKLVSNRGLLTE